MKDHYAWPLNFDDDGFAVASDGTVYQKKTPNGPMRKLGKVMNPPRLGFRPTGRDVMKDAGVKPDAKPDRTEPNKL